MRGTLHVTLAEDLGWIISLTAERMAKSMLTRHRQLEITTPDVEKVRELSLVLLERLGGRVTRDELFAAWEQADQATKAQRGYHLLFLLCLQGTLVQGPMNSEAGNGNSQFFVSSEDWIKNPRTMDRGDALAELALRYFRSHGPATINDFQWWSKLMLKDIRAGLDVAAAGLATIECGGASYYLAPETAELLGGTVAGARSVILLPGFDEYLLGYTDRSAALAPEHAQLTVPGSNGMFKATVVTGGQVAGTWRKAQTAAERESQRAGVVLPELFDGLTPSQDKGLEKSAKAYVHWLNN